MGGGGKTTAETGVPDFMKSYYTGLAQNATNAVNSLDRSQVKNTVAGTNNFDRASLTGSDAILRALSGMGTPGRFVGNVNDVADGKFLRPWENPAIQGLVTAATQPVTEQLQRQVIPGIRQASTFNNAYGGDRMGLAEGQAVGDWAQASGNIAAGIYGDQYNRERAAQLSAPEMMLAALQAEMGVPMLQAAVGEQQRGLDQLDLNNIMQTLNFNNSQQMVGYDQLSNILASMPFRSQTSTQVAPMGGLGGALQGGIGGYAMLEKLVPGMGWLGGIGGALGGGLSRG